MPNTLRVESSLYSTYYNQKCHEHTIHNRHNAARTYSRCVHFLGRMCKEWKSHFHSHYAISEVHDFPECSHTLTLQLPTHAMSSTTTTIDT